MNTKPWTWIAGLSHPAVAPASESGRRSIVEKEMVYRVSDRLVLRPLSLHESRLLFQLVQKNRAHLSPWLNWMDDLHTIRQARQFIQRWSAHDLSSQTWAVGIFEAGQLRGMLDISHYESRTRQAEIGFWLDADAQGRGLMRDVVNWCLRHCFEELGLKHVTMQCAAKNLRSIRLSAHFGFSQENSLPDYELRPGEHLELLTLGLSVSQWLDIQTATS